MAAKTKTVKAPKAPKYSDTRKTHGVTEQPIPATRVYCRSMAFDHKHVEALSWLFINDDAGTYTAAQSYGGRLGAHFNPDPVTYTIPEPASPAMKRFLGKLEKYSPIELDHCPLVVAVEPKEAKPTKPVVKKGGRRKKVVELAESQN